MARSASLAGSRPSVSHIAAPPTTPRRSPALIDPASNGAVVERLARMRAACQALAVELAGTRRELRAAESELRRLKRGHGDVEAPSSHGA
jgi:hypothetical protein